jgi:nucleoside-diphosphate-sugar epimerase
LYAEDCAKALLTLTEQYNTIDKTQNYHITSFQWSTIKDVARIIANIHGKCRITYDDKVDQTQKNAMNEPDPFILNYWEPSTTLKEGIIKVYNNVK